MIPVTKSFAPPIEEYQKIVQYAFDNSWFTNRGKLVTDLEETLKKYLGVEQILITNNGTIPIQIAIKMFGRGGEIITTPFSYIATTSSIVWENCKPVFVDIDPDQLTIDETKIEEAITPKTTALLATHVFGNPCNVDVIEKIASKNNLKVIYDAAHCFGVKYKGESVFNFGDISTCSFHSTKIFHTGEGGALICNNDETYHEMFYSHNFGHNGPHDFFGVGINGKISELQAAMGLAVLPYMDMILSERKKVVEYYRSQLDLSRLKELRIRENTEWNYSYYPVIFATEAILLSTMKKLNELNIFPRRYFYPSLNTVGYVSGQSMPVSESISPRILCLPLYVGLTEKELSLITKTINSCL